MPTKKQGHSDEKCERSYVEKVLPSSYLSSFQSLWKDFIDKSIAAVAQPLMYQYLTDRVFEAIIESVFTVKNQSTTAVESLTYEEANVLR